MIEWKYRNHQHSSKMAGSLHRYLGYNSRVRQIIERLLPLMLFIALALATEFFLYGESKRKESIEKQNIVSHTGEIRALIESKLNASIHLASGLVSFIKTKDGRYAQEDMQAWLLQLHQSEPSIRNISLAPGNRIQIIAPLKGNESALGLYFPDIKEQWPAVEKTIAGKQPVLAGPFQLKQGGLGLAYRIPVFLNDNQYWGLVSTILNAEEIFAEATQRANDYNLHFGIYDLDQNKDASPIYGTTTAIATQNASHLSINIPGRHIELRAVHKHETVIAGPLQTQRLIGWFFALLLSLLLSSTLRSYRRQSKIFFALNESQQRFTRAFDTAPQGMALINDQGNWISVNPKLCQLLGFMKEELLLIPPTQLSGKLNIHQLQTQWKIKSQTDIEFETALSHHNGSSVYCHISLAMVDHRQLEKPYWILQVIDLSRRLAAEEKLKDSAEYTQTILNNVTDGIISTTLNGQVRSINPMALEIWKLDILQFYKSAVFSLLCPDETTETARSLKQYIANVQTHHVQNAAPFLGESQIQDHVGAVKIIEFSICATQQKEHWELIIVVRDISERKRLETMKNEFVSTVSHELRTPLTSIIGSLKLIEGGILGAIPEAMAKMIRIARQNGEQLSLIINDILDMDKLVAGKMDFDLTEHQISELVECAIEANQAYAKQYQVHFKLMQTFEDCKVIIDSQRLQQVMSNLLSNAAKFSHHGHDVEIYLQRNESKLRITVRDYGEGIPLQYQDRLFKKFSQVDGTSTRKKGGTGLGLSICKEMIEQMNGEIGFTSKEGEGSSFFITLPLAPNSTNYKQSINTTQAL